jgi:hypothetical protein
MKCLLLTWFVSTVAVTIWAGGMHVRIGTNSEAVLHIVKDEVFSTFKRSIDVRLDRRYEEPNLKEFAEALRKSDKRRFQRTFIMFYLSEMKLDAGAWATAIYNPDLKIQILGLTKEEYEKLQAPQSGSGGAERLVGRWLDDRPGLGSRMEIFRKQDEYFIRFTYKDGSGSTEKVESASTSNGTRVARLSRKQAGEFYIITKAGHLEFWDKDGRYYIAKKLD